VSGARAGSAARACPACGAGETTRLLTIDRIPVFCNVLYDDAAAARAARVGAMDLTACSACGLLFNADFDPTLVTYAAGYENSLHFSPVFQRYADALARRLIEQHSIGDGHIVEVGSGSGEFLERICELSGSRGTGFDPSHDASASGAPAWDRVRVVAQAFTGGAVQQADLILCRHVLEHVDDPPGLLADIRRGATAVDGDPPVTYIEVPDATYMLEHTAVWDLIYEHYTYWSDEALPAALGAAGFRVLEHGRSFGDQFLWVDAVPSSLGLPRCQRPRADAPTSPASSFGDRFEAEVARWRHRVKDLSRDHTVVIWGAGSKGVTFVNVVDIDPSISAVVDVNPRKHGRHVPGTGHRITGPVGLRDSANPHVLLMNGMYEDEVRATVADLGLGANVEVV
jgi:SAM-dependent methyltransferase